MSTKQGCPSSVIHIQKHQYMMNFIIPIKTELVSRLMLYYGIWSTQYFWRTPYRNKITLAQSSPWSQIFIKIWSSSNITFLKNSIKQFFAVDTEYSTMQDLSKTMINSIKSSLMQFSFLHEVFHYKSKTLVLWRA